MKKVWIMALGLVSSGSLWAYDCYFTVAKDNCWTKYNVTVNIFDAKTATQLSSVAIPSGTPWVRQKVSCVEMQKLLYKATFSPIIWESERGKIYNAKDFWSLPQEMKKGGAAWSINVCFPSDFSNVPMPPEAIGNCKCDFSTIPAVPPQ